MSILRLLLVAVLALMAHAAFAGTTWNPSDKNASITLSGGNLVATQSTTSSSWRSVRSTTSYTVGTNHKVVVELLVTTQDTSNGWIGGLGDAGFSLASYSGGTANSFGIQPDPVYGLYYGTGVSPASAGTSMSYINPSTSLYLAIDFNTGRVWFSTTCMGWAGSGSSGGGDPSAGATPFVTLNASTAFYVSFSGFNASAGGDAATIVPQPNLSGCTNLSGFTTWDAPASPSSSLLGTVPF